MIDIEKQIGYWKGSGEEDWEAARRLLDGGMIRHGLFFAHLALEKMLKARVSRKTQDIPPRIHNLITLAQMGGLEMTREQTDFLADMNVFQAQGRYPEMRPALPDPEQVESIRNTMEETLQWLTRQL